MNCLQKRNNELMQLPSNTKILCIRLVAILTPPPNKTIVDWAKEDRIVSGEEASAPGPWYSDGVPYTDGIMLAISDPKTEKVVVKCAAQMGKTNAAILNPLGYYITYDPCPIMIVQPTIQMAQSFSLKRITPMLRDTPCLRKKIVFDRSRSSENKILEKSIPGGYVVISGANSAPSLKSRPIRILLVDETDEMPEDLDGQGDPIELAIVRTNAFPDRKIVLTSTPTIKGHSKIETAYDDSTREHWMHQCPKCGEWSQFIWTRLDFATVKMGCPYCDGFFSRREWEEGGGKWIAENPEHVVRGFHVNALDSQMTWETLISKWLEAQRLAKKGDFTKLKTFINTVLAEEWEIQGEVVESHALEGRREVYNAELPDGVCVLTMGVDVQDNRLAYEIVGWGLGFESWGIEYAELFGDPRMPGVWNRVDELLARAFSYGNGKRIRISRVAVDTGGHMTPSVYAYCKARQSRGVYPIKGQGGDKLPLARPSKESREKGLFIVGVDGIKADIVSWLKVGQPGNGYCHFPKDEDGIPVRGYDAVYFEMLTAEKKVTVQNKRGYTVYEWHKVAGARNESFDCRVYARAALRIMSPNDDMMLKRMYMREPWSSEPAKEKPAKIITSESRPKKPTGINKRAMAQSINL
jgi:phage terminase large subunit GpA-like protein